MEENKYTQKLNDLLTTNPSFIYDIVGDFASTHGTDLANTIIAMYRYYEIGDNDINIFASFIKDVYDVNKSYYEELIINYSKEYDYALNNKRVVSRQDTVDTDTNTTENSSYNGKHTEIELPNKVVSADYEGYPNALSKDNETSNKNKVLDGTIQRTSTTTTEYNNEFLELKKQYLQQIRNVYEEFAKKFKECFYIIY